MNPETNQSIAPISHSPEALAELARWHLRVKLPTLQQALTGRFRWHHTFLLSALLPHLDDLEKAVDRLSAHIDEQLCPSQRWWSPWMRSLG